MYFRYPSPSANEGDQRSVSHQLVQCVYKKTSYPSPIQVQHLCFPKTIKDHPEVFVPFSTVISTGMIFYFVIFFQLLKGVGTKCWAPDAEYALHSVYQGGLFELRAGDEIFVSVSSPTMVNAEESASYFGAFRLDLWEERIGEKKKEAMGQWMDKQMGWRAWGLLNIHWLGGKKWSYRQKRKWRSGSSVFAWADALKDGRTGVWKIYMGEEYCKRIVDLPFLLSRLRESKTSR